MTRTIISFLTLCTCLLPNARVTADVLPIDPLWKSDSFRKVITGSFGIDSRIEPRITVDEEHYLNESAQKMAAGDRGAAIQVFLDSSILDQSPALLFSLATLQFEADDLGVASDNFKAALDKFPNFRDAHRNLAVVYVQQEKHDEARQHLTRAVELGTHDGLTLGLLGYCHAIDEHFQAALDAFRLASLTQPEEPQWMLGQAQALQALGRPEEAASIFKRLINDLPEDLNLWLTQADNFITLGRPIDALGNLEFGHRYGALNSDATLSLGHLYLQNGLPALALERYLAALDASELAPLPRLVEALEFLVNTAEWNRAKHYATVIDQNEPIQALLQSDRTDITVLSRLYRHRALIELVLGDPDVGAKQVSDWLAKEPLDGHALILLARFKEESGSREESEMLLEQAQNLPEHAAAAHLAHGKLLVSAGEYAEAVGHLERSQQLSPSESLANYLEAVRELAP